MFLTIKLCTRAKTELFRIELIICIKIDLALNNLQMLICHKTQTTNISIITNSTHIHKHNNPARTIPGDTKGLVTTGNTGCIKSH